MIRRKVIHYTILWNFAILFLLVVSFSNFFGTIPQPSGGFIGPSGYLTIYDFLIGVTQYPGITSERMFDYIVFLIGTIIFLGLGYAAYKLIRSRNQTFSVLMTVTGFINLIFIIYNQFDKSMYADCCYPPDRFVVYIAMTISGILIFLGLRTKKYKRIGLAIYLLLLIIGILAQLPNNSNERLNSPKIHPLLELISVPNDVSIHRTDETKNKSVQKIESIEFSSSSACCVYISGNLYGINDVSWTNKETGTKFWGDRWPASIDGKSLLNDKYHSEREEEKGHIKIPNIPDGDYEIVARNSITESNPYPVSISWYGVHGGYGMFPPTISSIEPTEPRIGDFVTVKGIIASEVVSVKFRNIADYSLVVELQSIPVENNTLVFELPSTLQTNTEYLMSLSNQLGKDNNSVILEINTK